MKDKQVDIVIKKIQDGSILDLRCIVFAIFCSVSLNSSKTVEEFKKLHSQNTN